ADTQAANRPRRSRAFPRDRAGLANAHQRRAAPCRQAAHAQGRVGLGRAHPRQNTETSEATVPVAQNRSHSAAVLELLRAQFPRCFSREGAPRRRQKVGIQNDVLLALGDGVPPSERGRALQVYVPNRIYQSRLRPSETRLDLNGEPAGTVTAGEAAFARAKERARKEQRPTPSSPPRSSFAELRAAGQRRRAEADS